MRLDRQRLKLLPSELKNASYFLRARAFRAINRRLQASDIAFMYIEHAILLPFIMQAQQVLGQPIHLVKPGEDFSRYRKVIIPNGMWPSVADATRDIPTHKRVYCEIGFLPQTKNVYFDLEGVHGHSSIRSKTLAPLEESQRVALQALRDVFRQQNFVRVKWDSVDLNHSNASVDTEKYDFDFYFVPLQLTSDTAFKLCPFDSNQAIIDYVEKSLPNKRLIFKVHPLDPAPNYQVHADNILLPPDNTDLRQLLLHCKAIVAANSTVILEALMLHKPCATYGIGFTTNHQVTLECHDALGRLADIENWRPDWARVDQFLWLILNTQISIDFSRNKRESEKLVRIFRELGITGNIQPEKQHSTSQAKL